MKQIRIILAYSLIAIGAILPACKDKTDSTTGTGTDTTTTFTNTDTTTNRGMTDTNSTARTTRRKGSVRVVTPVAETTTEKKPAMSTDTRGYYNYTETLPVFPGGQSTLEETINNSLEYPEEALDNNVEGTVTVRFTIDENGKVGNVQTTGPTLGHGLEEAAMKAISSLGKWTPGTVNGKNVKAWYSLPLTFRIEQ
jgi:periplasmic protein TonB